MNIDENRKHCIAIEKWVRTFIKTMDKPSFDPFTNENFDLEVGDNSGNAPFGVKIIFDGYAEDDDYNLIKESMSFAVFVHKDSLKKEFKEYETNRGMLCHRPKEECYINCWYDSEEDNLDITTFIEDKTDDCTELDRDFVIDLICKIYDRDNKE